jgi:RES domain-containing protein
MEILPDMILFKTIHKDYVSTWSDYTKTSSFRQGARWNNANIPVMYTSSNAQNAMLEIANYVPSPKMVNQLYRMAVFEFPELRLHTIEPVELPTRWHGESHEQAAKDLGEKYLLDTRCDGIKVPSATINRDVATHSVNTIRSSVYANVIVNLERIGLDRIKLIDSFSPIYPHSMFI